MDDQEALYKVTTEGNHPSCPFHHGVNKYFIGLDVVQSGRMEQHREFTNGDAWNDTVHGELYTEGRWSRMSPCCYGVFDSTEYKPGVRSYPSCIRDHMPHRFICLKEAPPSQQVSIDSAVPQGSEAVSTENMIYGGAAVLFLVFMALLGYFASTKWFKKDKQTEIKHIFRKM